MEDLLSDLRLNLRSEKVTSRKNGKKLFDDLQSGKFSYIKSLNPKQTIYLLEAAATYQELEIGAARSKNKDPGIECANFYRSVVRYCIKNGSISPYHMVNIVNIVNMTIAVLSIPTMSNTFRNVYKNIICDLLDPSLLFIYPFNLERNDEERGVQLWFTYLRDTLIDRRSCSDPTNVKLLKYLCASLFHDMGGEASFSCLAILDWLNQIVLSFGSSDNDEPSLTILATVCECFASIFRYHGLNILNQGIEKLSIILQPILKHLNNYQTRQVHLEAFFCLLDTICDILLFQTNGMREGIVTLPSIQPIVGELCKYFVKEDFLTRLFNSWKLWSQGKRAVNKESLGMLDDPKVLLSLGVASKLWLIQRLFFATSTVSSKVAESTQSEEISASPLEERESKKRRIESSSGKVVCSDEVDLNVDFIDHLIYKLKSLNLSTDKSTRSDNVRRKQESLVIVLEGTLLLIHCYFSLLMKVDAAQFRYSLSDIVHKGKQIIDVMVGVLDVLDDRSVIGSFVNALSQVMATLIHISSQQVTTTKTYLSTFASYLTNALMKVNPTVIKTTRNEWYKIFYWIMSCGDLPGTDLAMLQNAFVAWELHKSPDLDGLHALWSNLFHSEMSKHSSNNDNSFISHGLELLTSFDETGVGLTLDNNWVQNEKNRPLLSVIVFTGIKLHSMEKSVGAGVSMNAKFKGGHSVQVLFEHLTNFALQSLLTDPASWNSDSKSILLSTIAEQSLDWDSVAKTFHNDLSKQIVAFDNAFRNTNRPLANLTGTVNMSMQSLKMTLQSLDFIFQIWNYQLEEVQPSNGDINELHVQMGLVLGHIYCVCMRFSAPGSAELHQAKQGNRLCLNGLFKLLHIKLSSSTCPLVEMVLNTISYSIFLCGIEWAGDNNTVTYLQTMMSWCRPDGAEKLKRKGSKSQHMEESLDFEFGSSMEEGGTVDGDGMNLDDTTKSVIQKDIVPLQICLFQFCAFCKLMSQEDLMTSVMTIDDQWKIQAGMVLMEVFFVHKSPSLMKYVFDNMIICNTLEPLNLRQLYFTIRKLLTDSLVWDRLQDRVDWKELQGTLLQLVFESEDADNELDQLWSARLARLECVICVLQAYNDVETFKDKLPNIFLRAIEDSDIRIRQYASEHSALLIKLFRNPVRVYEALVKANPIGLESIDSGVNEDTLQLVGLATSIVTMAGANPDALLRTGLFDLFKMYASRHAHNNVVLVESIILAAFRKVAIQMGYDSAAHLLQLNFTWLFHDWQAHSMQNVEDASSATEALIALCEQAMRSFPFQIFYTGLTTTSDRAYARKFVLSKFRDAIIAIAAMNLSPRMRWIELTTLCKELEFPTHDAQVARLIQKSLCKIKALEVLLKSSADLVDSPDAKKKLQDASSYVEQFVVRTMNETEITEVFNKKEFQLILEMLSLLYRPSSFSFYKPETLVEGSKFLNSIAETTCKVLKIQSLQQVMEKGNYLTLLAQMTNFATTGGVELMTVSYFAILKYVVENTNILVQEVGVFYLLKLINLLLQKFPSVSVDSVVELAKVIASSLPLKSHNKINPSIWRMIFSEFTLLYFLFRGQLVESFTSWKPFVFGYYNIVDETNVILTAPTSANHARTMNNIIHELIQTIEKRVGENMFCDTIMYLPSSCCEEFFGSVVPMNMDVTKCFDTIKQYFSFQGTQPMIWLLVSVCSILREITLTKSVPVVGIS